MVDKIFWRAKNIKMKANSASKGSYKKKEEIKDIIEEAQIIMTACREYKKVAIDINDLNSDVNELEVRLQNLLSYH